MAQSTLRAVVKSKRLQAFQEAFQNILVVSLRGDMTQVDQYDGFVHRCYAIGGQISVVSLNNLI